MVAENQRGLEVIVHAAGDLMEISALEHFSKQALGYLSQLLQQPLDGLVAVRPTPVTETNAVASWVVLGAVGQWAGQMSRRLDALDMPEMLTAIAECVRAKGHYCGERATVINLCGEDREGAIYLHHHHGLSLIDRQLLGVFAANLVPSYGNVRLLEKLNYVAYHDSLTGLPNRTGFIRDLDLTAQAAQPAVVALVDLRHFSDLNDGLGHDLGNSVLCAFAARLQEAAGGGCHLARVGADVFGMIGPETDVNPSRLFEIFSKPLVVGDVCLPISLTLGFCRLLGEERSGLALLKSANIALNRAKRSMQASYEYFVPEMEDAPRWRLEIIHRLRHDFEEGGLQVWYQPKIALSGGACVGVEALLRWPAVGGGFVQTPDVFIPLAEYSGLIVELGDWVLEQACRSYSDFARLAPGRFSVAVNVSMPQFRQGGFVGRISELMASCGIPRGGLELEVTESVAMDEPKVVTASLSAVREVGVKVAIDDFGTGYSSLAHLRELPIDCLKIDRAFIKEISGGKGGMFAETIVALGQKLGMSIVAEGVETEEQAGFLRGMGCHMAQGFLYAKPMSSDALMQWLADRPA
jgi:diguanylate cyclase (GGDEF)-like protein